MIIAILIEIIIFSLSSLISFLVGYYHSTPMLIQEIVLVLLVIVLIFSRKYITPNRTSDLPPIIKDIFLLLCTIFIQLLIISSGGFNSPFLILFHLYTLGLSLLVSLRIGLMFLGFSLTLLFANLYTTTTVANPLLVDPTATAIYAISFLTIIPLSIFLARTYHFQNTVSSLLTRHIQLAKKKEELIMINLNELVIVTDPSLLIVSANEAVERTLKIPLSTIVGKPLLQTIKLEFSDGKPASINNLTVDQVLLNKTTYLVQGFSLYYEPNTLPKKVTIQVSPLTDLNGIITQLVFVITNLQNKSQQKHSTLEQARIKHKLMIENLKKSLASNKLQEIRIEIELLSKIEEDLFIAVEVGDYSIKTQHEMQDVAQICQNAVLQKIEFAKNLGVGLEFVLPEEEYREKALMDLVAKNTPKELLSISIFSSPTDITWLDIMIQKIIDIAVFIGSKNKNSLVKTAITHPKDNSFSIIITVPSVEFSEKEQSELFEEYYGQIGAKTNLSLGSGLEGFIVKNIALQLNVQLKTKWENGFLTFTLIFSQLPLSSQ